jgi:hypothetical protein
MTDVVQVRAFERPGLEDSANLLAVRKLATQVTNIFSIPEIIDGIIQAHVFGASSAKVQAVILKKMNDLGFQSERKGLFKDMTVSGIRPDYYKQLDGGGILFEVERGKTIANNMDLLDVWKTHICREAKHLFLMVPRIRVTGNHQEQKIFQSVEKRIGTFFDEQAHDIDVESVHLFGY